MMLSGGFAFLFFVVLIPYLLKNGIQQTSPLFQFFIFNVGIFIFLQIYLKAKALNTSVKLRKSFELMLVFMVIDVWVPPLMVSTQGILTTEATLSASASDYLIGYTAISLGLKGFSVYIFTYFIVPIALLYIASRLNGSFVTKL